MRTLNVRLTSHSICHSDVRSYFSHRLRILQFTGCLIYACRHLSNAQSVFIHISQRFVSFYYFFLELFVSMDMSAWHDLLFCHRVSPDGVDIVLDCLCGEDTNKGINILKPLGRYVLFGEYHLLRHRCHFEPQNVNLNWQTCLYLFQNVLFESYSA